MGIDWSQYSFGSHGSPSGEVKTALGEATLVTLIACEGDMRVRGILHELVLAQESAHNDNNGLASAIKVAARKLKRLTGLRVGVIEQIELMEACAERLLDTEQAMSLATESDSVALINPAAEVNVELARMDAADCAVASEIDTMRRSGIDVPRRGSEYRVW